jgi:peroxiredoxin
MPPTVAPAFTQATIGYSVGERVPDFQLTLVDGSTFSAQDLISEGRTVFLFFTASW